MKFLVDEMPYFDDECPFGKKVWTDKMWENFCTLVDKRCNLYGNGYHHECYSLKAKGADDDNK